jgi:hypothetical protein
MPRDVTIRLPDGTSQVYQGVPDDVPDSEVQARAEKDFKVETLTDKTLSLGRAAGSGLRLGAKQVATQVEDHMANLSPLTRMATTALDRFAPGLRAEGRAKRDELLSDDFDPAAVGPEERYVRSGVASMAAGLPTMGWTPGAMVLNTASGLGAQFAREGNHGQTWETVGALAPYALSGLWALIRPRAAGDALRETVNKLPDDSLQIGRDFSEKAAGKGLKLLPGQAVEGAKGLKSPLETLTEKMAQTQQGAPIYQFLDKQDEAAAAMARAREQATQQGYTVGGTQRLPSNNPRVQATQMEIDLLGSRRSVPKGGPGARAITDIQNRTDLNLNTGVVGGQTSSMTALNSLSRELMEQAQRLGPNTVDGAAYVAASVKLKRLAESSPDVATANRIYAEYSKFLDAAGRARAGLSHANPPTYGDAGSAAPATGAALAATASKSDPGNMGWAMVRPIGRATERAANKSLVGALADPSWSKFDKLLNQTPSNDLLLSVLRAMQAKEMQLEE